MFFVVCGEEVPLLSFPRDGELVLDVLTEGCVFEASCKVLYEGRIWIKVCRGGVTGPSTGRLLDAVAYVLDSPEDLVRIPGPAVIPGGSSSSSSNKLRKRRARRLARMRQRAMRCRLSARSSWPRELQGASPESCLYALAFPQNSLGDEGLAKDVEAFAACPATAFSHTSPAEEEEGREKQSTELAASSSSSSGVVVGVVPAFSVVEVDEHVIDRRTNELWGHVKRLPQRRKAPQIPMPVTTAPPLVATGESGKGEGTAAEPAAPSAAAPGAASAAASAAAAPTEAAPVQGETSNNSSVLSDTERYIQEMQRMMDDGGGGGEKDLASQPQQQQQSVEGAAAAAAAATTTVVLLPPPPAAAAAAAAATTTAEPGGNEGEDTGGEGRDGWVCLSLVVGGCPAFRVVDLPLGQPWTFRNVFTRNAGRLPIRTAPQLDAPILEYLPAFISTQARGSVLTASGQLWARLSPQFRPFVDGYVIQTNASDGSEVLEPFALHGATSSSAASSSSSSLDYLDVSDSDDDGFRFGGGGGGGGGGGSEPSTSHDSQYPCFRNVLKKAALPFREDPELSSAVVARLPLGGCLRSSGGQRLITKEGQLWVQCLLRRNEAGGGASADYDPVWAVERNARDGTPILKRIRPPQVLLNDNGGEDDDDDDDEGKDNKDKVNGGTGGDNGGVAKGSSSSSSAAQSAATEGAAKEEEEADEEEVEGESMVERLARLRRNKQRSARREERKRNRANLSEGSASSTVSSSTVSSSGGADQKKAARRARRRRQREEAEQQRVTRRRRRRKKGIVYRVMHQGALPVLNTPGFGLAGSKEVDELSAGDIFVGAERRLNEESNPPSMWVGFRHYAARPHAATVMGSSGKGRVEQQLVWVPESMGGVADSLEEVRGVRMGFDIDDADSANDKQQAATDCAHDFFPSGAIIDQAADHDSGSSDDSDSDDSDDAAAAAAGEEEKGIIGGSRQNGNGDSGRDANGKAASGQQQQQQQQAKKGGHGSQREPSSEGRSRSGSAQNGNEGDLSQMLEDILDGPESAEVFRNPWDDDLASGKLNNTMAASDDDDDDVVHNGFARFDLVDDVGAFGDFLSGGDVSSKNSSRGSSHERRQGGAMGGASGEQAKAIAEAAAAEAAAAAAAAKAVSPEEAAARAAAQRVAGERQLKDLLDALDNFADEDARRETDRKRRQRERQDAALFAESAHLRATPTPVVSPPGNWFLGALTVRLRPHTASKDARRALQRRRMSGFHPAGFDSVDDIGGGAELDDYDFDETAFDEMDDDEFERYWGAANALPSSANMNDGSDDGNHDGGESEQEDDPEQWSGDDPFGQQEQEQEQQEQQQQQQQEQQQQQRQRRKRKKRSDVTIYYTTDGSIPNPRFALTMPLTIQVGPGVTTIRAMAVRAGLEPSPVVSAKYVVYGWEAPAPALRCALEIHHTLFRSQLVQRLRRRLFWPRRRGGLGAKRSAYAGLSTSFDEASDGGAFDQQGETADDEFNSFSDSPGKSPQEHNPFAPTFVSPGSATPNSRPSVIGGSRRPPHNAGNMRDPDFYDDPCRSCFRTAASAVAWVIRTCKLRPSRAGAGYGSIGETYGDLDEDDYDDYGDYDDEEVEGQHRDVDL